MGKTVRGLLAGSEGKTARDLLPLPLYGALRDLYSARRVEYIAHLLTLDEVHLLPDLHDALVIARLKRMPIGRLRRFDQYIPSDGQQQKLYEQTQVRWIQDEEYLLGLRLGRKPTPRELYGDFTARQMGLRFRAYYTLKYRNRMRRKDGSVLAPETALAGH